MFLKTTFNNGDIAVMQTLTMETVRGSYCSMQYPTTEQHYKT